MLKLLLIGLFCVGCSLFVGLGGLLLVPLLILPGLLGGFIAVGAVALVLGLVVGLLRVMFWLLAGVFSIVFAVVGLALAVAGIAAVFGAAVAIVMPVLVPLAIIFGIVWLARRGSAPVAPPMIARGV